MKTFFFTLFLLALAARGEEYREGGVTRGPRDQKSIALEFTADEFTEGAGNILNQLAAHHARASFFLTGRCARRPENAGWIRRMIHDGHYVGSHSDAHPLLCPWSGPKKTLVTKEFFQADMKRSFEALGKFGVSAETAPYFVPPYEWYNEEVAAWGRDMGLTLINFTPGTRANADYTEDSAPNFTSSASILDSIKKCDERDGLGGFLLLMHLGAGPARTDKMSDHIGELLDYLQGRGYKLVRVDELLKPLYNGEPYPFDTNKMDFVGTPVEAARWLLRPVMRGGVLGRPLARLPDPLEELIGQPVQVSRESLRRYLQARKISEDDLGGPITNSLRARFFIIHDTSTPNYGDQPFPADINKPSWRWNHLEVWKKHPVAHVFVSRTGESITCHEFIVSWRTTQFESKVLTKEQSRGLFVGIENSVPRRSDPRGRPGNDAIAPKPGFTVPMLDRLALLYLTASVEHGRWLTPMFHATLDAGIPDAHDDPQNFDLALWAKRLGLLLKDCTAINPG